MENVKKVSSLKGGKLIKVTKIAAASERDLKHFKDSEELEVIEKGTHFDVTV